MKYIFIIQGPSFPAECVHFYSISVPTASFHVIIFVLKCADCSRNDFLPRFSGLMIVENHIPNRNNIQHETNG